jgi:hypothetical protein
MIRNTKLLALFAVLALTAGACADPAAHIAATDAAASQDGGGTGALECNRQNGSGSLNCP